MENKNKNDTIESMTVCIAALAEKGKEAVLIADKLITSRGLLPYQIEAAADKIIKVNDNVYVMFCGGVADATVIIENAKKNIGDNKFATDIANHINNEHMKYLFEILERTHVTGRGIESLEKFYTDKTLNLTDETRRQIDSALATYNLNSQTQFIVCGKDSDGLFRIYYLNSNPRNVPALMMTKYSTIGSGNGYANFSLIQSQYNDSLSSDEVKELLQKAKKEAEKDRDVGDKEDIVILK